MSYLGENSVAWRVNPIRNNNQPKNVIVLAEKLIQLEPNDWPKFQEQLKILHSAKIHQIELKEKKKKERKKCNKIIKEKICTKATAQTQTTPLKYTKAPTKQRSHKFLIHPPQNHQRQAKKLVSQNQSNKNQVSLISLEKSISTPKWTMKDQEEIYDCFFFLL